MKPTPRWPWWQHHVTVTHEGPLTIRTDHTLVARLKELRGDHQGPTVNLLHERLAWVQRKRQRKARSA